MGIPTLISTSTASDSSSVDITSGIDSTYDEYMFVFTDIGPATDGAWFTFQFNADGGSGFNETITSTTFQATHTEADGANSLVYATGIDQAQGTGYQCFIYGIGSAADESGAGILHVFSPASTTYVTHFYGRSSSYYTGPGETETHVAGYVNATAAMDEISFKMSSGNFDGTIKMYGLL
jgi:hypothetical protein